MKLTVVGVVLAGLVLGVLVGVVGTGGAFLIPVLVYIFKMGQLRAQGNGTPDCCLSGLVFPVPPVLQSRSVRSENSPVAEPGHCFGRLPGGSPGPASPAGICAQGICRGAHGFGGEDVPDPLADRHRISSGKGTKSSRKTAARR